MSISISSLGRLGVGLWGSGVPFARDRGGLRSPRRSDLGPREGGLLDLSLTPFRVGERERSRYRSPFDGYPI